jgi:hypothetical protein
LRFLWKFPEFLGKFEGIPGIAGGFLATSEEILEASGDFGGFRDFVVKFRAYRTYLNTPIGVSVRLIHPRSEISRNIPSPAVISDPRLGFLL